MSKEYNKLVRETSKNPDYVFVKEGRKCTVKLTHIPTNSMYSIHPGLNAVKPLQRWMNKLNKQEYEKEKR